MTIAVPSLDTRRAEALAAYRAKGIPHRRIEEWKYSDLRSALDDDQIEHSDSLAWAVDAIPAGVAFFDLADSYDRMPGWVKQCLGSVSVHGAMDCAALAFGRTGLALHVSQRVTEPMRLAFSAHGHARLLVVVDEGASLTLVETQAAGGGLRNIGVEFVLGAGARLEHIRVAEEAADSVAVESVAVSIGAGAEYRAHFTSFGAKLSRVEANIVLQGEGAQAHLSGVDVLTDATHADTTTHVDHAIGNTQSTQLFKKVAGGKARSVYQGKVTVRAGADGSDSRQTAKGLLLSERAEIDLKPELEIFADDVKCAHGAAVGDLDTDSLFYLRARGVPEAEARNLLVHAFLADALDGIGNETLRGEVWSAVESALLRTGAA
ncbi:MAG TPA: Fe-S cluster assembly protein SufD [Rhizomicrobium sp.]|jgi:Fe-S cluster assembly protein SufD